MTPRPSGRARQHHVGGDRRAAPRPESSPELGVLALAVPILVVVWILLEVVKVMDRSVLAGLDRSTLATLFEMAVVCLAGVVALLAFLRWRLAGTAEPLYLGTAVLLLGVFAVAIAEILPQLSLAAEQTGFVEGLEPSARVVALLTLLAAAVSAPVDTRITPWRVLPAALAATVVVAGGLHLVEPAGAAMTSRGGQLGIALAWVGVAGAHAVAGRRRSSPGHLVVAAAAVLFALASLTRVLATGSAPATAATAMFFELVALLLLFGQGLRDLERAFCDQRARLLEREVAVETMATLRRVEHEVHEERAHDAESALLSIEAAATMLERHRDQLDPGTLSHLREAVSSEIAHLQELIAADPRVDSCAPFSLAELLTPLVTAERARGARIDLQVPGDLVAVGRGADTAEVLRNLFENARRYAPGSPVTVTATADGHWVLVHVEDRGHGVERTQRETIFERGKRGSSSAGTDGSGLGLYVSRRLMRDQGGDLWVEPHPGGGARFAFCLPLGPLESSRRGDSAAIETIELPVLRRAGDLDG